MTEDPWDKPVLPPPPPYSGENDLQTCPKCGNEGHPSTHYRYEAHAYTGAVLREWFNRSCRTCGYTWREATLDTERTPE